MNLSMRATCLGFLAAIAMTAAPATAQEPAPERDDEARALFQAAVAAFNAGRYEDALERFEDAYEASPRPELLYNLGATADRLQREDAARSYFRAYLEQSPNPERRGEVEARLAALDRSIQERDQLGRTSAEPTPAATQFDSPSDASAQTGQSDEPLVWGLAIGGGAAVVVAAIVIGILVGTGSQSESLIDGDVGGVVFALGAW